MFSKLYFYFKKRQLFNHYVGLSVNGVSVISVGEEMFANYEVCISYLVLAQVDGAYS